MGIHTGWDSIWSTTVFKKHYPKSLGIMGIISILGIPDEESVYFVKCEGMGRRQVAMWDSYVHIQHSNPGREKERGPKKDKATERDRNESRCLCPHLCLHSSHHRWWYPVYTGLSHIIPQENVGRSSFPHCSLLHLPKKWCSSYLLHTNVSKVTI